MQFEYDTPRLRRILYKELIRDIDRGDKFGMCIRLGKLTGIDSIFSMHYVPELAKQAPDKHYSRGLWFFIDELGMQQRKQALLKAIALCDIQLSKKEDLSTNY